jgi:NitT/TauT family transport system permease protein
MTQVARVRLAILIGGVALVEVACRVGIIPTWTLTPPSRISIALAQMIVSGEMRADAVHTLRCIALAIALATSVGFVVGVLVYGLPKLRNLLEPLLATYYAIPHFIFYPLFVVLFGIGPFSLVLLGFFSAVVAMIINTLNGLDRVPRVLRKTARTLRMGRVKTALLVVLPAAASYVFTGVKLAVAYSFVGIVGGEFILSTGGLGHQISLLYFAFDNDRMYGLIVFILALATLINMTLHSWDKTLQSRQLK